eukprot:GEZU01017668.1.p1 GENE.GEZU01017668.1~~GEZU01017668.1.p1  ORF type:complete len:124 (+),score=26.80 GEZU01017668.1:333-704(+)
MRPIELLICALVVLTALAVRKIFTLVQRQLAFARQWDPARTNIKGPAPVSSIAGNIGEMLVDEKQQIHVIKRWADQFEEDGIFKVVAGPASLPFRIIAFVQDPSIARELLSYKHIATIHKGMG